MWYLYVLLCKGGSLYTGVTNNLDKRFAAHQAGKGAKYTRANKPLKVLYTAEFADRSSAQKREAEVKGWSREKKIVELKLDL